jgi:hypothetical protein
MSTDLAARGQQLRATVAEHKAAIRRHREQLGAAKAALDRFEAECRQRGIAVTQVPITGAGGIHGHRPTGP